ncbi:MAG: hypothetical protein IKN65_06525 [Clostridia bacterium]|nr:hypothetical protein [Clostridia bacterium]
MASNALYNGTNSMTSTTVGTYIGTGGIRQYKSSSAYVNIKDGVITAVGASISGAITATSLSLGSGVTIAAGKVSGLSTVATSGKYTDLSNTPNLSVYVQKDGTIGSTPAAGATGFKVSSAGLLTCSNAVIYGTVYASAGKIANWTISGNMLECITNNTSGTQYRTYVNGTSAIGSVSSNGSFGVQHRASSSAGWVNDFYVLANGALYANNADITGKITASSGTIAGWTITSNQISKNVTLSGSTYQAFIYAPASPGAGTAAFGVSKTTGSTTTYPCYIRYDGALVATSAIITGGSVNINASSSDFQYIQLKYTTSKLSATMAPNFIMMDDGVNYVTTHLRNSGVRIHTDCQLVVSGASTHNCYL